MAVGLQNDFVRPLSVGLLAKLLIIMTFLGSSSQEYRLFCCCVCRRRRGVETSPTL